MYTKKGKFDLYTLYLKQMNRIALIEPKQFWRRQGAGEEAVPKKYGRQVEVVRKEMKENTKRQIFCFCLIV